MPFGPLFASLNPDETRGSRLRTLYLTHCDGDRSVVSYRLNQLISPYGRIDPSLHDWMPKGFHDKVEAQIGRSQNCPCNAVLSAQDRQDIMGWWLKVVAGATVPTWDLVSTCSIEGKPGILLVEAKAHDKELSSGGKQFIAGKSNVPNHEQIKQATTLANQGLNSATVPGWNLSRDSHYQLSNRFAWAWKIASLGHPVILLYLGFLGAWEMADIGIPFRSQCHWQQHVLSQTQGVVPPGIWENQWPIAGVPFVALIRSADASLG